MYDIFKYKRRKKNYFFTQKVFLRHYDEILGVKATCCRNEWHFESQVFY